MMLDPWLVTGFADGEGCFSLFVRADRQKRKNTIATYYRWEAVFAITLRGDDHLFLQKVRDYFDCGTCLITNKSDTSMFHDFGQSHLSIRSIDDLLNKVVPHFQLYPLQSKKASDFILWFEALKIISSARSRKSGLFKKVEYTEIENTRLLEIKEELKKRVTGGQFIRKRVDTSLQGTKIVEMITSI